jgi:thymidylate synthase ThyX
VASSYEFTRATVVADSIGLSEDSRVATFVLTYPRFIHGQMMTHRMAARNAQSSRAVPVDKMISQVMDNPVMPVEFLEDVRGMVGGKPLDANSDARRTWLRASVDAAASAMELRMAGVHKQHANRILEPFLTITAVFTFEAKWLTHFFGLRLEHDAQPEIQCLARDMYDAVSASTPSRLSEGQWHVPLMTPSEISTTPIDVLSKCSAARCARASYLNFDGTKDINKDLGLFSRLQTDGHLSPLEHVLTPVPKGTYGAFEHWESLRFHSENPLPQ